MLVAKSGYLRTKIMESDHSEPTCVVDISEIPGGAEAFEKVTKFCYGVNFEITINNVAALRCAAEFLEMKEMYFEGNLANRTEEFLNRAAMKSLPSTVAVLRSCERLRPMAEQLNIVQRCVDALSMKVGESLTSPSSRIQIFFFIFPFFVNERACVFRSASNRNSRLVPQRSGGPTSSRGSAPLFCRRPSPP